MHISRSPTTLPIVLGACFLTCTRHTPAGWINSPPEAPSTFKEKYGRDQKQIPSPQLRCIKGKPKIYQHHNRLQTENQSPSSGRALRSLPFFFLRPERICMVNTHLYSCNRLCILRSNIIASPVRS